MGHCHHACLGCCACLCKCFPHYTLAAFTTAVSVVVMHARSQSCVWRTSRLWRVSNCCALLLALQPEDPQLMVDEWMAQHAVNLGWSGPVSVPWSGIHLTFAVSAHAGQPHPNLPSQLCPSKAQQAVTIDCILPVMPCRCSETA
jgi:hypothetical protein